jgi:hypothetical protein
MLAGTGAFGSARRPRFFERKGRAASIPRPFADVSPTCCRNPVPNFSMKCSATLEHSSMVRIISCLASPS